MVCYASGYLIFDLAFFCPKELGTAEEKIKSEG
jgi:hypothetical protein